MLAQTFEKIFVIGLPRTGTTSFCVAMLNANFRVAHTAYINDALQQAQVLADTPIFCDYPQLDQTYSGSKFVYLTREIELWLPSIRQLLSRMQHNLLRQDGGFNPIIKRCYQTVFRDICEEKIADDNYLINCYQRHQQKVLEYFANRQQDLLVINISENNSVNALTQFLNLPTGAIGSFDKLNVGGKVTAWKGVKHPNKIESTRAGRVEALSYQN